MPRSLIDRSRLSPQSRTKPGKIKGIRYSDPVHFSPETATVYEHETIAKLRMLVGELHDHPAAKRLADYRCPIDVEDFEKITDPTGERTQRVIPDGLFGQTVTHEVRRNHG
jgi:hypothetical protein